MATTSTTWLLEDERIRAAVLSQLQSKMAYQFKDIGLLERCFLAGDTNSIDREGHRGLSQLGDSAMGFVVMSDGMERRMSRAALQTVSSEVRSRDHCARIAKVLRLDQWLKLSDRQVHAGVQPTNLKNVVAALIGAVWLDSHEYLKVLGVMLSIGILNTSQYHDQVHEDSAQCANVAYDSFDEYWSLLPEADQVLEVGVQSAIPLEHDLHTGTLDSPSSPNHMLSSDNSANVFRSAPSSSSSNAQHSPVPSTRSTAMQSVSSDSSNTQGVFAFTPSTSDVSEAQETFSSLQSHRSSDGELSPPPRSLFGSGMDAVLDCEDADWQVRHLLPQPGRMGSSRPDASHNHGIRKVRSRKISRKSPGRPRADEPATLIRNYIDSEARKTKDPETRTDVAAVMRTYREMIGAVPGTGQGGLAAMVVSVGDSSALSILKAAVSGLRSQNVSETIRVDKPMSIQERLRVIRDTAGCIELLRLTRVLHIVALWRDLVSMEQNMADPFVINTPESLAIVAPRPGNPIHIGKANVARGMSSLSDGSESAMSQAALMRLRRLGQRLDRLVRAWGEGVLLLLGQSLNDARILDARDGDFNRLIDLMDHHEGPRIREVSTAAEHVLRALRTGDDQTARLELEATEDESLREIPRLSDQFVRLLRPADDNLTATPSTDIDVSTPLTS